MARSYGKILASIWGDPDWRALPHGAQHAYLLLISQAGMTLAGSLDYLPGRWAALTADTTPDDIEHAIAQLEAARFVVVDHATAELVVRTLTRHDLDNNRLNINLVKGLWAAWAGIISATLRKVVVDNLPPAIWERSGASVPAAAEQMRRSPRLELPVPTTGSDQPSEPVVPTSRRNGTSEPLSPSPSPSPSPAAAASRDPRAVPPDTLSTGAAAAVDIEQTFTQMLELAADAELERNPSRGNPTRHRAAVIHGKRKEYADAAYRILHQDPTTTATELLAAIEPHSISAAPSTQPPAVPHSPWTTPTPGRRVDIATEEETQARLDALRNATPTNPDTAAAAIADMRRHLRTPPTTDESSVTTPPPNPTQPDAGPGVDRTE